MSLFRSVVKEALFGFLDELPVPKSVGCGMFLRISTDFLVGDNEILDLLRDIIMASTLLEFFSRCAGVLMGEGLGTLTAFLFASVGARTG